VQRLLYYLCPELLKLKLLFLADSIPVVLENSTKIVSVFLTVVNIAIQAILTTELLIAYPLFDLKTVEVDRALVEIDNNFGQFLSYLTTSTYTTSG
jgi:hypothetical protein